MADGNAQVAWGVDPGGGEEGESGVELTPFESAIREADERLEVATTRERMFDRGVEVTLRDARMEIARTFALPERLLRSSEYAAIQRALRREGDRLMEEARQLNPATAGSSGRSFGGTFNAYPDHPNARCVTDVVRGSRPRPVQLSEGWWSAAWPQIRFNFSPSAEDRQAAEARAEELLTRILTEGERQALDRLGVVPVIGGKTGELVLVSRESAYNLLRYSVEELPRRRGFGWLPLKRRLMPRMWCLTNGGGWAPWQDRVASIVTALRHSERLVTDLAVRCSSRSIVRTDPDRITEGVLEREIEPLLRYLAEDRCGNLGMIAKLDKALNYQGLALA